MEESNAIMAGMTRHWMDVEKRERKERTRERGCIYVYSISGHKRERWWERRYHFQELKQTIATHKQWHPYYIIL